MLMVEKHKQNVFLFRLKGAETNFERSNNSKFQMLLKF